MSIFYYWYLYFPGKIEKYLSLQCNTLSKESKVYLISEKEEAISNSCFIFFYFFFLVQVNINYSHLSDYMALNLFLCCTIYLCFIGSIELSMFYSIFPVLQSSENEGKLLIMVHIELADLNNKYFGLALSETTS